MLGATVPIQDLGNRDQGREGCQVLQQTKVDAPFAPLRPWCSWTGFQIYRCVVVVHHRVDALGRRSALGSVESVEAFAAAWCPELDVVVHGACEEFQHGDAFLRCGGLAQSAVDELLEFCIGGVHSGRVPFLVNMT